MTQSGGGGGGGGSKPSNAFIPPTTIDTVATVLNPLYATTVMPAVYGATAAANKGKGVTPGQAINTAIDKQRQAEIDKVTSSLPKYPEPPKINFPQAREQEQQARVGEALRARGRRGTRSTILTGALGVPGDATVTRKTLLGQ